MQGEKHWTEQGRGLQTQAGNAWEGEAMTETAEDWGNEI